MPRFVSLSFFLGLLLLPVAAVAENRTIDGSGNNLLNPLWGVAGADLLRTAPASYADGISEPNGASRPSARVISNTIVAQASSLLNNSGMSDWVFQWGQFIDHDLGLTDSGSTHFDIAIPAGDTSFDPQGTGTATMGFTRSLFNPLSGTSVANPRQQVNAITAYIDGSMVYGSDSARAAALRSPLGGGQLATSSGNLLPLNTGNLPNATGGNPNYSGYYLAGDVRANEQIGLTAIQTLMVREHNTIASQLAVANPTWDDDAVYQQARKIVGAEIQAITFQEFLPALLGSSAPGLTSTYNPTVNAGIATEFSSAFFRVGHTMLSPTLQRIQSDGTPAPGGPVALRDTFFRPQNLSGTNELEYILHGLATQQQQTVDIHMIDDVRNFLFGPPLPNQGFDLASLNIQRGRDHGLPDYNSLRAAYGLVRVTSFADITSDTVLQSDLAALYGTVDNIDAWVGALSEDAMSLTDSFGSHVGPLITAALFDQFSRARDGDRFWFLNDTDLSAAELALIQDSSLCDIILRNTGMTGLQPNVFLAATVPEPGVLALGGVILGGLLLWRRKSKRASLPQEC